MSNPSYSKICYFRFTYRLSAALFVTGLLTWLMSDVYLHDLHFQDSHRGILSQMRRTVTPVLLHRLESQFRQNTV
ncbi:hypothetical protein H6G20_20985 [Desertifilum sp. FACHB-1129]|uniref:Uncharacterized protein n=1 Tax=Desertifilum tharense IPPAS B-1220 TaxID=1781255 RepID=A0A1E5QKA5_9CYAN|nr:MULTISPECIES: hypothetical protein [Desertifilum]MDA0211116.1 hypothetical protein [Cyanobacteria bacterium FC1]MDI9636040.1 hypothetical protein [Geitlerinema splendidum]MBD2314148.1 hypothetical protein [Desertifilum sp. FACHB-1129]MBD2320113.1 hypothetical protein [Desertifilum sp. FACHB-866]MBD2330241.1 hypothetical protein [Desertifilum sp. FACHB-868]